MAGRPEVREERTEGAYRSKLLKGKQKKRRGVTLMWGGAAPFQYCDR